MLTRAHFLRGSVSALAALAAIGAGAPAQAANRQTDQQLIVDGAHKTLVDLRHDKAFGNAAQLLKRARGVLIVPKLIKGGFIVGGEGGEGVLMVQERSGMWSPPAFYSIGSASFGLQAGLQQSEMVLLVMTQRGLDGLLRNEFKIGAQAGISVVNLGSGVQAAMGGVSPPDIVVWSSSSGLYGGLTIEGSIIRPDGDNDRAYYGRPVSSRDILFGRWSTPQAEALRRQLGSFG